MAEGLPPHDVFDTLSSRDVVRVAVWLEAAIEGNTEAQRLLSMFSRGYDELHQTWVNTANRADQAEAELAEAKKALERIRDLDADVDLWTSSLPRRDAMVTSGDVLDRVQSIARSALAGLQPGEGASS